MTLQIAQIAKNNNLFVTLRFSVCYLDFANFANFATLQLQSWSIFSGNMSIFSGKEIIFWGFNFVNFANAGCENGCFLRYRLLAPCLRVGTENTHCECVLKETQKSLRLYCFISKAIQAQDCLSRYRGSICKCLHAIRRKRRSRKR